MCCVIQKEKFYKSINTKGCSDRDSYTKYKIWVSGEDGIYKYKKEPMQVPFYLS